MSDQPTEQNKFASLSSGLLARKGDARPAMRRPTVELPHGFDTDGDDLGWNDFGEEDRAASNETISNETVVRQRQAIADRLGAEQEDCGPVAENMFNEAKVEAAIRPVVRELKIKARSRGRSRPHGSAAFTLRLDSDRHLRLRLACAVHDVSAQKLLTEALDALFGSMPELEPLAERVASR